jgi:hypothetical protein
MFIPIHILKNNAKFAPFSAKFHKRPRKGARLSANISRDAVCTPYIDGGPSVCEMRVGGFFRQDLQDYLDLFSSPLSRRKCRNSIPPYRREKF